MMRLFLSFFLSGLFLLGSLLGSVAGAQEVQTGFTYQKGKISKDAKIFLVAGSAQAANFAQEILDHKKLFLKAGFPEEEIACYYVPPYQEYLERDLPQYQQLKSELAQCYLASTKRLLKDLKRASKGKEDFLYLYITSHGQEPFDQKLTQSNLSSKERYRFFRLADYPALREYHLSMEALPDGPANFWEILGALRMGADPAELYLTGPVLTQALEKYFGKTPKYVVLQACHSGGFIWNPSTGSDNPLLHDLKNITVLTSTRYDRESFGCQPGVENTVFGKAYLSTLAEGPLQPLKINWRALFERVEKQVSEAELNQGVAPPSLPQFFSNQEKISQEN